MSGELALTIFLDACPSNLLRDDSVTPVTFEHGGQPPRGAGGTGENPTVWVVTGCGDLQRCATLRHDIAHELADSLLAWGMCLPCHQAIVNKRM